MTNTINPSSLSPRSPSPSSTSEPGPSRKRPRSETSSEDRKEARAHRNRIAAQNSRDRRKAQFSFLERRVAELEEENCQLRISVGLYSQGQPVTAIPVTVSPAPFAAAPVPIPVQSAGDLAREQENAELKERIKTLERGWDAVVKALAAQGLPTGLAPVSAVPAPQTLTTPAVALPSPAPSHSSLDIDMTTPPPSSSTPVLVPTSSTSTSPNALSRPVNNNEKPVTVVEQDSTRHLARMATTRSNLVTLQRSALFVDSMGAGLSSSQGTQSAIDEQAMEELFREILVPVPSGEAMSSGEQEQHEEGDKENTCSRFEETGHCGEKDEKMEPRSTDDENLCLPAESDNSVDWATEIGMQRLLDSISTAQQTFVNQEFAMNDMDLGLLSWNEAEGLGTSDIGVF